MKQHHIAILTRRGFLGASLVPPLVILLAACGRQPAGENTATAAPTGSGSAVSTRTSAAESTVLPSRSNQAASTAAPRPPSTPTTLAQPPAVASILSPTPACDDGGDATLSQTEGPYFTPNSPKRASLLESGIAGTKIMLTGRVLSTSCQPISGALLDFWHADDGGEYDNSGFKLRGHQFSDQAGGYSLETVVPGLYPGRTRHFHVKVQAPNKPVLTTQLYFPGEASNQTDRIFSNDLVIAVQDSADGKTASFDFVLAV